MYGAALYRLRKEDFELNLRTTTGSLPRGPSAMRSWNPTTPKRKRCTRCHGVHGADWTEPPQSAPYPDEPFVSNEPRIEKALQRPKTSGLPPISCSLRGHARRTEHPALQ